MTRENYLHTANELCSPDLNEFPLWIFVYNVFSTLFTIAKKREKVRERETAKSCHHSWEHKHDKWLDVFHSKKVFKKKSKLVSTFINIYSYVEVQTMAADDTLHINITYLRT
jgi:hypothetical protein